MEIIGVIASNCLISEVADTPMYHKREKISYAIVIDIGDTVQIMH